jgi:hypothetical protein
MRRAVFLRQLPAVMESIFGTRKCHSIERGGRLLRGFRGVTIRLDDCPATPESEPERTLLSTATN